MQWPEDFDFESTRALNMKVPVPTVTSGVEYNEEKTVEKGSEKGYSFTEAQSAVDDEGTIIASDPDLDPASLDRAFRFAAWSSAALVCNLSPRSDTDSDDLMATRLSSCSF